jgi:glycosidase
MYLKTTLFFALLGGMSSQTLGAAVDRVDPPNWWVGMADSSLQLMMYGNEIGSGSLASKSGDVTISQVTSGDSPNYLFVDLTIHADAEPQTVELLYTAADGTTSAVSYPLHARRENSSDRQGFSARDTVYLIMPDRFANGDPSNDTVDHLHEPADGQHPYGRHGGDLAGITKNLDYFTELGMTQLWMTPVLENNQKDSSYHGYAVTDLYRVDARLGRNSDYVELSRGARKRGIGIIHDFVPNHIGSEHPWMHDLPTADWINRDAEFSPTNHRRETHQDPYASDFDKGEMITGWFVPTMPDLNQQNPLLATYLIQNILWWIETADLSGVRVDTWPYNDRVFLSNFTGRVLAEYPKMSIVGEEWSVNPATIAYWQKGKKNHDGYDSGAPQLMDFPLQEAIREAVNEEERWDTGLIKLYQVLADDFLYPDPMGLMLIADNHDMTRLYPGVDENFARYKMAMTFLATTRGIPQMLYGTELLMNAGANGDHGRLRADFPGGWSGDRVDAFKGKELSNDVAAAQNFISTLFTWRRAATAIHNGDLLHFAPRDGIYVYFRFNEEQRVMVVMNNEPNAVHLDSSRYAQGLAGATRARNVLTGDRLKLADRIKIPAKTAQVFEID